MGDKAQTVPAHFRRFFLLAAAVFVLAFSADAHAKDKSKTQSSPEKGLLNPIVYLQDRRANVIHLQELRANLLELLGDDLDNVAIYVEDLNSGVWMGINERQPIGLGSLLKVPLMVAWFKWDQEDAGMLEKRIAVTETDVTRNDRFSRATDSPLLAGQHRVIYLVEKMIKHSDNTALAALSRNISKFTIHETFTDIGVPNPFVESDPQLSKFGKLSAKQYSQVLKSLYNSSYLDPTHSEMALRILTKTRFDKGIRSVLPKNQQAAIKYGFWEGTAFHESGIVYLEKNPYLISIFTQLGAENVDKNLELIRVIGKAVYDFFVNTSNH